MNAVVTRSVRDGKKRLQHHAIVVGQIPALTNVLPDTPDSREETARCEGLRTQQQALLHVLATLGNGAPKAFDLRVAQDPSAPAEESLRVAVLARVSSSHSATDAENLAGRLWTQVEQSFPPSYDLYADLADERSFLDSVLPDREELDSAQIWELRKRPSRVKLTNNPVVEVVGTYADHLDAMVEAWTAMARMPSRALLAVRCIPLPKNDVDVNRIRWGLESLSDDTSQAQSGSLDDARARFQDLLASSELMLLRVQLACWSGDPRTVLSAIQGNVATSARAGRRGCDCQWHAEREIGLYRARDDLAYMTADDVEAKKETWQAKARELVSVTEASALWRLPIATSRYTVEGIPTRRIIPASPAAVPLGQEEEDYITLGAVVSTRGAHTEQRLPIDSLSRHLLIVGETGSGKSTTTHSLVWQLWERGVPSLVIEPSSSQYADLWRLSSTFREADHHLRLFPLGAPGEAGEALAFNPLCPQPGTSINAHIAYMTTCFAAALELAESWREMVRSALRAAYEDFGWQSTSNQPVSAVDLNARPWPSFVDLIKAVEREIAKFPRGGEFRGNAEAGLLRRLREMLYGTLGALVTTRRPLDLTRLVQRPVVVELKSLGHDGRAKSLCMLFLLAHLREYYDSIPRSEHLTHMIIVEEAHRLLSPGYVNPQIGVSASAEAVTMIAEMLAEQRKQGIGLAIVEQLPTRLERVIPKLPVTKILHRLTAADDRDLMADAMNLTHDQARYVATMETGEVMFYTEGLSEPILLHIADPWGEQFAPLGRQARPTTADKQQQAHDDAVASTLRDWRPPTLDQRPWNPCDWCGCRCEYRMRALEATWWRHINPDEEIVAAAECAEGDMARVWKLGDSVWAKVEQASHDQSGIDKSRQRSGLTLVMEERARYFDKFGQRRQAEQGIDRLLRAIGPLD